MFAKKGSGQNRESSQKNDVSAGLGHVPCKAPDSADDVLRGQKPVFSPLFILEMIIFPRQAQDKHWEKAQKRDRFLAVLLVQPIPCAPRWRYSPQQLGGLVRGITG
jgi:hypothetical protein